jgi:hypothetical protein
MSKANIYILRGLEYVSTVTVIYDGVETVRDVHRYGSYEDKILFSTIVRKEEPVIKQWIHFHKCLGVDNFIIYDNADVDDYTLRDFLKDEIDTGLVLYIKWPYQYAHPTFGNYGQTSQQNHSIYTFRKARYIGLFDVDEFLNPQVDTPLQTLLDDVVASNPKCGAVSVYSKIFRNPKKEDESGFEFLKIAHASNLITNEREKVFAIPKYDIIVGVHNVSYGSRASRLDTQLLYFNHYFFLNKKGKRGYDTNVKDADTSILRHAVKYKLI